VESLSSTTAGLARDHAAAAAGLERRVGFIQEISVGVKRVRLRVRERVTSRRTERVLPELPGEVVQDLQALLVALLKFRLFPPKTPEGRSTPGRDEFANSSKRSFRPAGEPR